MSPAATVLKPSILFIDAYDSFSNNIVNQVEQCLSASVHQIHIDDARFWTSADSLSAKRQKPDLSFAEYLRGFDAVIAGPGPGWANDDSDVGLIKQLWSLEDADLIPVLGICLGFQSLCLAFGGKSVKLNEPKHGIVHEILHKSRSIFEGVEQLMATQYHSLQIGIGHAIQTEKRAVAYPGQLWMPTEQCPLLEPLAWDFESEKNGAVLMGVRHLEKPFWGVQFHPESICTNAEGGRVIKNWWECAMAWKRKREIGTWVRRGSMAGAKPFTIDGFKNILGVRAAQTETSAPLAVKKAKPKTYTGDDVRAYQNAIKARKTTGEEAKGLKEEYASDDFFRAVLKGALGGPPEKLSYVTTGSGRLTVSDICEAFGVAQNEAIVLESGLKPNLLPMGVGTGRYSIIGLTQPDTLRIHWSTPDRTRSPSNELGLFQLRRKNGVDYEVLTADPWKYIKSFMEFVKPKETPVGSTYAPFWGGLMGYASYEAGLETIDVPSKGTTPYPDVCFAFVTRSIVIDHQVKKVYVQSLNEDEAWIQEARDNIHQAAFLKSQNSTPIPTPYPKLNPFDTDAELNAYLKSAKLTVADEPKYCQAVQQCQEVIADGHSYELCLTAPNTIRAQRSKSCVESSTQDNELSWKLYKRMTARNPAPFSAYLRLHNVHVLSSSPERFISWDRNQSAQCRPIKGTVQKGKGVTREDAETILSSSKERAENLMIVDLVRHQLHGVYGSGNVHVSRLMQVEEYETLYQLVSVVDAIPSSLQSKNAPADGAIGSDPPDLSYSSTDPKPANPDLDDATKSLGFEAFVHSLPAGSMTGAPKKRSCEILQRVEPEDRRGIYSGVLGYLDVGGGGDFSVVIRTAVKTSPPSYPPPTPSLPQDVAQEDVWTISAGGAITSQSTPEGEYAEMKAKFESAARGFSPGDIPPRQADSEDDRHIKMADLLRLLEEARNAPTMPQMRMIRELAERVNVFVDYPGVGEVTAVEIVPVGDAGEEILEAGAGTGDGEVDGDDADEGDDDVEDDWGMDV